MVTRPATQGFSPNLSPIDTAPGCDSLPQQSTLPNSTANAAAALMSMSSPRGAT